MIRKLLLTGVLFLSAATGMAAGPAAAYQAHTAVYPDVGPAAWSKEPVYVLSVLGVVSGYEDGSFRPGREVTREAFVKMLMAAVRPDTAAPAGGTLPYADVARDRWSYPYFAEAEALGIVAFLAKEGRMEPGKPMLREEVGALAGRYLLLSEENRALLADGSAAAPAEGAMTRPFPDESLIDPALRDNVYAAVRLGVLEGDDTGNFRPKDTLTREQAAAILYRLLDRQSLHHQLEYNGFYALGSYGSRSHIPALDRIIYGWSNLDYAPGRGAALNTATTEYKVPEGAAEVTRLAEEHRVPQDLMIFGNGKELTGFLEDEASWPGFLQSLKDFLNANPAFGGICLDLEGLLEERYREPYSRLAEAVREAAGGRSLSIAVPPAAYYKGYDTKRLGAVADRIILMAYDFTHDGTQLPSAPLPHVQEALAGLLRDVPREKVILGVSKQANQWVTDKATGEVKLYSPSMEQVEARLQRAGTSASLEVPYFLKRITYDEPDRSSLIWYEDEAGIARKLWLARYYGIKGVSFWHMGNMTARDWELIRNQ